MKKSDILQIFSRSLREIRENSGKTMQEFADSCNIPSVYTLQNYLYGKSIPSINIVINICTIFTLSPNTLFAEIIDYPTEHDSLKLINRLITVSPDSQYGRLFKTIQPMLHSMINGAPKLLTAKLGTRIKILREDSGISKEEFAELCNINTGTLRSHESEQRYPGSEIFLDYCRIFKISPEYLLCNDLNLKPFFNKELYGLTPQQINAVTATIRQLETYFS